MADLSYPLVILHEYNTTRACWRMDGSGENLDALIFRLVAHKVDRYTVVLKEKSMNCILK